MPTTHPDTKIGHVHLKVADIERALKFYRDILGFEVVTRMGDSAAFLSAGGYHHHIGLNTWESKGANAPPPGHTGLYHFAILFPNRAELAKAVKRLIDAHYPLDGASDHGVSEAIYLHDPDGNGIELYRDRPKSEWPKDEQGNPAFTTKLLDLDALLKEAEQRRILFWSDRFERRFRPSRFWRFWFFMHLVPIWIIMTTVLTRIT